jgi:hypothetical protein
MIQEVKGVLWLDGFEESWKGMGEALQTIVCQYIFGQWTLC